MYCSTPGFRVHHQLPELAQIHLHQVGVVVQPCYPLLSPSCLAFSLSQHQGSFQWVGFLHQVPSLGTSALASVLPVNIQDWFPLGLTGFFSLAIQGTLKTTVQKHQNSLALSFLYGPILTPRHDYWKNHSFNQTELCWQSMPLLFNMVSRFVIAFLPRSKCLLIS